MPVYTLLLCRYSKYICLEIKSIGTTWNLTNDYQIKLIEQPDKCNGECANNMYAGTVHINMRVQSFISTWSGKGTFSSLGLILNSKDVQKYVDEI